MTCGVATQSDERSLHYEVLAEAETAATAAKKGLHAPSQPTRSQTIDLSLPTARDRAKSYISSLQRHGRVRAIVQVRAVCACPRTSDLKHRTVALAVLDERRAFQASCAEGELRDNLFARWDPLPADVAQRQRGGAAC